MYVRRSAALPIGAVPFFSLILSGCIASGTVPSSPVVSAPSADPVNSAGSAAPSSGKEEAQQKAEEAALAALMQQLKQKGADYRISPADLIEITIYREADLGRIVRVSQNGSVSLPLVGTVQLGGLTPGEAQDLIAGKMKDFLKDPQVTIFIKDYGNKKVFVLGEVAKPGSYDLPPESRLTILEAVSMAGGFTQIAARDRTKIIRTTPAGISQSIIVEISAITHKGEKDKDIPLEPNDVVYVPQSFF